MITYPPTIGGDGCLLCDGASFQSEAGPVTLFGGYCRKGYCSLVRHIWMFLTNASQNRPIQRISIIQEFEHLNTR